MRENLISIVKKEAAKHDISNAEVERVYNTAYNHHRDHHGSLKPYKSNGSVHSQRTYVQMLQERHRFCFRYVMMYVKNHNE